MRNVIFEDPDVGDVHMATVDWRDGSAVEREGELLEDGTMTGPVLSEGAASGGTGSVSAEHVHSSSGDFTAVVCVRDNVIVDGEGNKSLTGSSTTRCLPISFTVAPMVDLIVDIQPSANPYAAGAPLAYDLVVTNQAPDSGEGLTTTGLHTLDTRLTAGNATKSDGICSSRGHVVTCDLDALAPGEQSIRLPDWQLFLDAEIGVGGDLTLTGLGAGNTIDAGRCQLPADQVGAVRPADGDLDGSAACDIGATEFIPLRNLLPLLWRE